MPHAPPDPRVAALVDLDAMLDALEQAREPEVLVRPEGGTREEWTVLLGPDRELRRAKRNALRCRLLALSCWAEVLVYDDASRTMRPERIRWPEPPGLPFPEVHVEALPVPVPSKREAEEEAAESRPHSRYSVDCAVAVLWILRESGARLRGHEIARHLAERGGTWSSSGQAHTLAEMVKQGLLANHQGPREKGYSVTEEGRRWLQGHMGEEQSE